jgi:S1-C subfamily serine protease
MYRFVAVAAAAVAATTICTPSVAKGPFGSISIGQWKGGAYTNDSTGAFSHCAAGAQYLNGTFLNFGHSVDQSWTIGFGNTSFQLTAGETFPIDVTLDGKDQVRLFGTASTSEIVFAALPSSAVLNQFRKSHFMVAQAKGATFQFRLTSIASVLATISNCVAKVKAGGISSAGDFSLPATTPVAQAKPPSVSNLTAHGEDAHTPKTFEQDGTGFVISGSGHIVTNYHVIDGCVGEIRGNLTGESPTPLRIVSTDETNDLALLQASKPFNSNATIRATAVHPGDAIIAIGFPYHGLLTSDFTVTAGIISSLSGILNDTRYLQISAGVQTGNSGGPLFDMSGNVVGVVAAKLNAIRMAKATGDLPQNVNFAVKTGALRDFLDNSAVSYQTAESKQEFKTAEIATKARSYTILVSCEAKAKGDTRSD